MQYIVALTGGIGSGKNTVANAFAAFGIPLVDADVIAREIVEPDSPVLHAIKQRFGSAVLTASGLLDRAALRARIFSCPEEKSWLNGLLHPFIQRKTEQELRSARGPYVLWMAPLLIENNLQQHANRVLVVDVDREVQIVRTLRRDGVSRELVENILTTQVSRQRRLACADDVIDNSGCPEKLTERIAILHQRYLAFSAAGS
ncbi:dephospho-CoA kinase [Sodalis endosymbiont of Henestaris halophilus]|uniref:dephospho-CoA kinase n=1 Tax=Sodalis endosymbiont of Henestaris halophilus TaxID=1929246 RepID=UPI000BBF7BA4|nr:dephospho-CoA kinase [Sodalis endosymbiont of Henestaris halophilus]SNC58544.1 Dephospho-CoA kinase [Sodalis endosymbiont of Henestaris halophilus]